MKLNIGCGSQILSNEEGWVNLDLRKYYPDINILADARNLPFKNNAFDEVYSSHLIEHFHFQEAFDILQEWKRVIREGGKLVIETPDLLGLCKRFIVVDEEEKVMMYTHFFGWWGDIVQLHKFLYTEAQLSWTLDLLGFKEVVRVPALRYGGGDINLKMEALK